MNVELGDGTTGLHYFRVSMLVASAGENFRLQDTKNKLVYY